MLVNAYLYFNGQCEDAFRHYEKVLGGSITMMLRYGEAPGAEPAVHGASDRIMHTRLQIGDHMLMGSDTMPEHFREPQGFSVSLSVATPAEADRIFAAFAEGGMVLFPLEETFFAHRFGMVRDRFGTPWLINAGKDNTESDRSRDEVAPFVISRKFDAPRNRVWSACTQVDQMRQWWGPRGAAIETATMDLKPGGRFHYAMRTQDGQVMWGRMIYQTITPPERIEFINAFSDESGGLTRHPMAPTWPLEMQSTFQLAERDGKTLLTVEWRPRNASAEECTAFDGGRDSMRQGWTGTLDRLEAHLAKR